MQPGRPHHNNGFTLLELLVVISILAILATVVVTSIGHAQNSAKKSVTEGNIKLLQSALARYEADFEDFAKVIRGEKALAWTPTHDLAVQETVLKASGLM